MATAAPVAPIRRPSGLLTAAELPRALLELGTLPLAVPLLAGAPRGDGHPVLVLPGFLTTDVSTGVLRRYLAWLGHDVRAWTLGRNLGPRAIGQEGEHLVARLRAIHQERGETVSLVGWSLGGIMARLVAQREPAMVRQVVTMGSPFAGEPTATPLRRPYELLTGQRLDDPRTLAQLADAAATPSVPATAIYSRGDGIVAWRNCRDADAGVENIEVRGSHSGLGINAAALYAIADRLARPAGDRGAFRPAGWRRHWFPGS